MNTGVLGTAAFLLLVPAVIGSGAVYTVKPVAALTLYTVKPVAELNLMTDQEIKHDALVRQMARAGRPRGRLRDSQILASL